MTLSEWKNQGEYFRFKTHRIFVNDHGKGEVILLIHGFPTASWDWCKVHLLLVSNFRVISLDMLGFGFSSKPRKHAYSIFEQADLIEALLKEKGVKRVNILSHDYGDTVTQELLARLNERTPLKEDELSISSVCLLNGGLFPETHRPLLIQRILISPFGFLVGRFFNRKKMGKNFKQIFGPNTQPSEQTLDDFWSLIEGNGGKYVFHLLIRYMKERRINRKRWVEALQFTDVRLRLINGIYDPISGIHMVKRYVQLIPNPDVIELQNIGHFPLVESPEMVVKNYIQFLNH